MSPPLPPPALCQNRILQNSLVDGVAYQDAVEYAMENTDSTETLKISTADHGRTIAFNGHCGRGSPVTGLCYTIDVEGEMYAPEPNYATNGSTYTVISVGNGPGSILYEGAEICMHSI